MSIIAAIGFWSAAAAPAWAEGGDSAALAAAMKNATATLQGGLKASEAQGTPISAKFEIEDGKLQLSVYTMKGNDFMEVVADPKTGAIAKAEKITDAGDLKEATAQKAAMAKAKVPLLTAAETAVNANAGSRAVSIVPRAEERTGDSRSNLVTRDDLQEGYSEAGLRPRSRPPARTGMFRQGKPAGSSRFGRRDSPTDRSGDGCAAACPVPPGNRVRYRT